MDGQKGFTLVELLIVIVVIAILVTIVVVAYFGITNNAKRSAIASETKEWVKIFEAYSAVNGSYPAPSATPLTGGGGPGSNMYCLGTSYPDVGGVPSCYGTSGPYAIPESTGTSMMSQLSTLAKPPTDTEKYSMGGAVGYMLYYISDNNVRIYGVFPPGDCPADMTAGYGSTARQDCFYTLDYTR